MATTTKSRRESAKLRALRAELWQVKRDRVDACVAAHSVRGTEAWAEADARYVALCTRQLELRRAIRAEVTR